MTMTKVLRFALVGAMAVALLVGLVAFAQWFTGCGRAKIKESQLARIPHVFVPEHHGDVLPTVAKVDDALIPAWAPIRTPHAVLSDMFLVETERGCSRMCTYCVMRRTTNGGMRMASMETILALVPRDARRVGLVGAAVSDHPRIVDIVNTLADRGCGGAACGH